MAKLSNKKRNQYVQIAGNVLGYGVPLGYLFYQFWFKWVFSSPDPIGFLTHYTGKAGILLLIGSLAITPLGIWFGWTWLRPWRKTLGLAAFYFVLVHFSIFFVFDVGAGVGLPSWEDFVSSVLSKRYALAGLASLGIMLPLALTSNKFSQKKLKKKWVSLHKGAYAAGIFGVLHYIWLVKNTYTEPAIYTLILAVLLITRVPAVKKKIVATRKERARRVAATAAG